MRPVLILGRFVILEARRTGLPTLFACIAVTGFGLAGFLSQLALTESSALQASVLGAFFRLSSVFLISAFVISSMVRESNDKGLELLLSLPISRTQYFLGKLSGFVVCGAAMAGGLALLLRGEGGRGRRLQVGRGAAAPAHALRQRRELGHPRCPLFALTFSVRPCSIPLLAHAEPNNRRFASKRT